MTTIEVDDDPFAFPDDVPEPADEWADLPGENPTDSIRLDTLESALAEDPFATTNLEDCLFAYGIGPTPFDRYQHASRRYLKSFHNDEDGADVTEIHRLISLYWLRRSKPVWLD